MTSVALDMSNWSSELDAGEADCIVAHRIPLVICETVDEAIYLQQSTMAHSRGLRLMAYPWITWGSAVAQVQRSLGIMAKGPAVEIAWIDVEAANNTYAPAEIVQELHRAVAAFGAMPCGIYTSASRWAELTGDSDEFGHLPLWLAGGSYYGADTLPDADTLLADAKAKPHPAGWTTALIYQVGNTRDVCGQSVDVNVLNEEAEMVTQEEVAQFAPTKGEFGALFTLALQNTKALQAFGSAFFSLAQHVYGVQDPKLAEIQAEIDALDAAQKAAAAAVVP